MKTLRCWGAIWLGSLLILLAGISPAVGESNKLGGTERPVMEAMETQFTGIPAQVEALDSFYAAPAVSPEAVGWAGTMKSSYGAEDYVPLQGVPPVVTVKTPSFGTEDYVPPQGVPPVVTVKTPSFGTEDFLVAETPSPEAVDWAEAMERSDAVGTGAIPAPASMKPNLDDYYPD
jgi:hypothetical protein